MSNRTPVSAVGCTASRLCRVIALLLIGIGVALTSMRQASAGESGTAARDEIIWIETTTADDRRIVLYMFHAVNCTYCQRALPFLQRLDVENAWLRVELHEITRNPDDARLFERFLHTVDLDGVGVPAFFFCGQGFIGFRSAESTGERLRQRLLNCRQQLTGEGRLPAAPAADLLLPFFPDIDPADLSLPVLTVLLAGLDAFNPCAFFVLLFLLSLMVHARSRGRMLLVGGVFVLFSGLIYFAFMAAWLNLFQVIGGMRLVTVAAGIIALALASLNIKDFFWFSAGPSLSIPNSAKPGLFRRMRGLVGASTLPAMLLGTVTLAIAANSYELLCTAGFPMVFTRIVTLRELSTGGYYGYLALYNLIYILPMLAIVIAFVVTLGARKLSEREGRILKLLSGLMMLGLGLVLLLAPSLLDELSTVVLLVLGAVVTTVMVVFLTPKPARS